jgi:hypothetical protein
MANDAKNAYIFCIGHLCYCRGNLKRKKWGLHLWAKEDVFLSTYNLGLVWHTPAEVGLAHCVVPVSVPVHRPVASGPVKPAGHVAGVAGPNTGHVALVPSLPSGHVACVVGVPMHVPVTRFSIPKPSGHVGYPSMHVAEITLPKQPW